MSDEKSVSVRSLIKKGEGVLIKRNGVWTYPGCANDPSGTNLVLPLEHVSDAEVQKALSDGDLRAAMTTPTGAVSAVRLIEDETAVVSSGLAGTAELGTELPSGSRPTHDAGTGKTSAAEAEKQATDAIEAMKPAVAPPAPSAPAPTGKAKS
jgi:septal ring-binding cell division protein DamX